MRIRPRLRIFSDLERWRRAFSRTLAGTWISALARLLFYVVLTKTGGLEVIGAWGLGVAVAEPAFKFANLGLRSVHATDVRQTVPFRLMLQLRVAMIVLGVLACAGILWWIGGQTLVWVMALAVMSRATESLGDLALGEFQRRMAFHMLIVSSLFRLGAMVAAIALLWLSDDLLLALGVLVALQMGVAVAEVVLASGREDMPVVLDGLAHVDGEASKKVAPPRILEILRDTAHVGAVGCAIAYLTNVNRFAAQTFGTLEDVGILALGGMLIAIGQMFIRAIAMAFLPILAAAKGGGLQVQHPAAETHIRTADDLIMIQWIILVLMAVVGLTLAVAGKPLMQVAFSAEVASYTPLIGGLLAVAGIRYVTTLQNIRITATRHFSKETPYIPLLVVVGSSVTFGAIAQFGIWGAIPANIAIWLTVYLVRLRILAKMQRNSRDTDTT